MWLGAAIIIGSFVITCLIVGTICYAMIVRADRQREQDRIITRRLYERHGVRS